MQYVLVSLAVATAVAFAVKAFLRANPTLLARRMRTVAGLVLTGLAVLLLVRGMAPFAFMLLAVAFPLLTGASGGILGRRAKAPGQTSEIQTAFLRMQLDHDSGAMTGDVLAGPFAGRALASLGRDELLSILVACRSGDQQSAALLEAYLDHHHPDWRETADASSGDGRRTEPLQAGPMTPQEARDILGVGPGADPEEIRAAWRSLMKRNHPDQGGSGYLAAKINEAKDLLLGKGE